MNHSTGVLQLMAIKYSEKTGRKEGYRKEVALYVKEWINCTEQSLKNSDEYVESLWTKVKVQANKGKLMVGVYCTQPDQQEPVGEVFLLQLQEASCSQAPILLGDFSHPDICWKRSTARCKQPRRLLECI